MTAGWVDPHDTGKLWGFPLWAACAALIGPLALRLHVPPEILRLEDVERPVPNADEDLVRIHATTVTRADCATREANRRSGLAVKPLSRTILGIRRRRRRIFGTELAGEVEAVGASVTAVAVGDRVFSSSGFAFGAHAEFIHLRASARIAHIPEEAVI